MRKAELSSAVLLALFILIVTSLFMLVQKNADAKFADNILATNQKVISMKIISADRYDNTMVMPDGAIISSGYSYKIEFSHDNHIDNSNDNNIYSYCKDKIGQDVNVVVEEYEMKDGTYKHKIVNIIEDER